jgi:hypothetical protein
MAMREIIECSFDRGQTGAAVVPTGVVSHPAAFHATSVTGE